VDTCPTRRPWSDAGKMGKNFAADHVRAADSLPRVRQTPSPGSAKSCMIAPQVDRIGEPGAILACCVTAYGRLARIRIPPRGVPVPLQLFRHLLDLEIEKANRLRYCVSLMCLTPDLDAPRVDPELTGRRADRSATTPAHAPCHDAVPRRRRCALDRHGAGGASQSARSGCERPLARGPTLRSRTADRLGEWGCELLSAHCAKSDGARS
jgi:hypothetical protein